MISVSEVLADLAEVGLFWRTLLAVVRLGSGLFGVGFRSVALRVNLARRLPGRRARRLFSRVKSSQKACPFRETSNVNTRLLIAGNTCLMRIAVCDVFSNKGWLVCRGMMMFCWSVRRFFGAFFVARRLCLRSAEVSVRPIVYRHASSKQSWGDFDVRIDGPLAVSVRYPCGLAGSVGALYCVATTDQDGVRGTVLLGNRADGAPRDGRRHANALLGRQVLSDEAVEETTGEEGHKRHGRPPGTSQRACPRETWRAPALACAAL